jgi:hypothetical protein
MTAPMPRPNGRHRPRIPSNVVYRSMQAAGGRTALAKALGVSLGTLARWRSVGHLDDARAVLTWAALVHPDSPEAQLHLARQLAGCHPPGQARPGRRRRRAGAGSGAGDK